MIKLTGFTFLAMSLTFDIALAQYSAEIPVRWEFVEFTEPGKHVFNLPKNVDVIWVHGCGGGSGGIFSHLYSKKHVSPGEGAKVIREMLHVSGYNKITIIVGQGGSKFDLKNRDFNLVNGEDSKVFMEDQNPRINLHLPGRKSGAPNYSQSDVKGEDSIGLGGEPGEDALDSSCAGGGASFRKKSVGNGGSGYVKILWPLHLDRTESTLERIDELSLRDLMTSDELEALKSEIKEEVLREISTED